MAGWKDWAIGEVVTEGEFQSFIQDQVVQKYADATARDTTLGANVAEGMVAYLEDTNQVQVYNGTHWVAVGEGDITAVNAGTALTGGGTSGDVTLNVDLSAVEIPASQITDLTATATELNTLDGITSTTAELNFTDGVTSNIQTQLDDKQQDVITTQGDLVTGDVNGDPVRVAIGTADQVLTSNGTALTWADSSGGTSTGGLNYLINGAFEINQRGFTSSTNDQEFVFDRFQIFRNGGTVTLSAEQFTPGAAPFAPFEAKNFARIVTTNQSATDHFALLDHRIEDVRTLAGQTVTISFYARAGSGTPSVAPGLRQNFGTGGSSTVFIAAGKVPITTSFALYSITVSVPSLTGKTILPGNFLELTLDVSSGSAFNETNSSLGIQNNTFDFWGVQLEAGSIATPFKRNANSIQGELAACQRYYWRFDSTGSTFAPLAIGQVGLSTNAQMILVNPVEMRAKPTISSPDITEFALTGSSFGNIAVTSFALNSARQDTLRANTTINIGSSSLTAGNASHLIANNSSTAVMEFSAEL